MASSPSSFLRRLIERTGLRPEFLRGGLASILSKLGELGFGLLLAILLARLLGVDGYGTFAFVLAAMSAASFPVQLGLPTLVVRETAKGRASGDWPLVRGVWSWAVAVALGMVAVLLAVVGLVFLVTPQEASAVWAWGLILIPFMILGRIRSAALQGLLHIFAGQITEQVVRPAVMAFLVLLWITLYNPSLTADQAMMLMAISACAAFLLGAWLLSQRTPPHIRKTTGRFDHRTWLIAILPIALSQGMNQLNRYADIILLGLLDSTAEVGVYRVAFQGAILVSLGLVAINAAAAPFIADMYARGELEALERIAKRTAQAATALAFPAVVIYLFAGDWLLHLVFGPEFIAAHAPLAILAIGQMVNTAFGTTALILNMTGHEPSVTKAMVSAAILNVALNLALIPLFGATGAAVATSSSVVLWNIWLWRQVFLRLRVRSAAW